MKTCSPENELSGIFYSLGSDNSGHPTWYAHNPLPRRKRSFWSPLPLWPQSGVHLHSRTYKTKQLSESLEANDTNGRNMQMYSCLWGVSHKQKVCLRLHAFLKVSGGQERLSGVQWLNFADAFTVQTTADTRTRPTRQFMSFWNSLENVHFIFIISKRLMFPELINLTLMN